MEFCEQFLSPNSLLSKKSIRPRTTSLNSLRGVHWNIRNTLSMRILSHFRCLLFKCGIALCLYVDIMSLPNSGKAILASGRSSSCVSLDGMTRSANVPAKRAAFASARRHTRSNSRALLPVKSKVRVVCHSNNCCCNLAWLCCDVKYQKSRRLLIARAPRACHAHMAS